MDLETASTASLNDNDELDTDSDESSRNKKKGPFKGPRSRYRRLERSGDQEEQPKKSVNHEDFYNSQDSATQSNQSRSLFRRFQRFLWRNEDKKDQPLKTSRRIPEWGWFILVNFLGIRRKSSSKTPCMAIFWKLLTIFLACVFTVSGTIHTVYDIMSKRTNTSVLMGGVNLGMGFGWLCLGIYSNNLATRLFSNPNFVESVRLHSQTFIKMSVAFLLVLCGTTAIGLNVYTSFQQFGPENCLKISLTPVVCHIMYSSHVAFSTVSLVWNMFVGCVLIAVCRTHTVGIRRFIRLLDIDAKICVGIYNDLYNIQNIDSRLDIPVNRSASSPGWFVWQDEGITDPISILQLSPDCHFNEVIVDNEEVPQHQQQQTQQTQRQNSCFSVEGSMHGEALSDSVLTNEEILMSYWKISSRMRTTSKCLERWLFSWIVLIIVYCSDYIVYWVSYKAQLISIVQCLLPLFALFLLSAAFAQCNGEGQRMIKCICPIEERLKIMGFLNSQPLQMQVLNISITYKTILGVLAAFAVAFASRLIMDEISKI